MANSGGPPLVQAYWSHNCRGNLGQRSLPPFRLDLPTWARRCPECGELSPEAQAEADKAAATVLREGSHQEVVDALLAGLPSASSKHAVVSENFVVMGRRWVEQQNEVMRRSLVALERRRRLLTAAIVLDGVLAIALAWLLLARLGGG